MHVLNIIKYYCKSALSIFPSDLVCEFKHIPFSMFSPHYIKHQIHIFKEVKGITNHQHWSRIDHDIIVAVFKSFHHIAKLWIGQKLCWVWSNTSTWDYIKFRVQCRLFNIAVGTHIIRGKEIGQPHRGQVHKSLELWITYIRSYQKYFAVLGKRKSRIYCNSSFTFAFY